MSPPINIGGQNVDGVTIDGQEVQQITVDGDVVFTSQVYVIDNVSGGSLDLNWDRVSGNVSSAESFSGSFSFRVNNTSAALRQDGLNAQPKELGFKYYETSSNTGIAYKVYGTEGALIDAVGSSNPGRESEVHNPGSGDYNVWEGVTMRFDWNRREIDYFWRNGGSFFNKNFFRSSSNAVGEIEIGSYRWLNGGSAKNTDVCWVDDIYAIQ